MSQLYRRLESDLQRQGFAGSLLLMGSNGGVHFGRAQLPRSRSRWSNPGRSAAASAPARYGRRSGFDNVIAFDMGGTTAKCALVEHGRFAVEFDLLRRRAT